MIDNSDVIPPSAWTAVGGSYPNLYQATVAGPGTSTTTPYGSFTFAGPYINVFECKSAPCTPSGLGGNDNFLATVNTESAANSATSSYYIAGENGTNGPTNPSSFTIYMQTSDGTSPATNGYTYSYSNRGIGLEITGSNAIVSNIASKKSSDQSGNFKQSLDGGNATFNNIESDQGNKHNMFCTGGCVVNNSKFVDEYYPGFGDMFVAFDSTGSGLPVTLNNVTFLNGVLAAGNHVAAVYGHVGSGSVFSSFTLNGGLIQAVNGSSFASGGVAMLSNKLTVNGLTCSNVTGDCIQTNNATATISNSQNYSSATTGGGSFVDIMAANTAVTVASSSSFASVGYNHGVIHISSLSNVNITMASSTIYLPHTSIVGQYGIYDHGTGGGSVNLNNTIIDSALNYLSQWVSIIPATSSTPYIGDYNSFISPNMYQGSVNSIAYVGLSAWATATGQDAHSLATFPTAGGNNVSTTTACTLNNLAFAGPTSGNVNSASTNFTVTPNNTFTGTVTISPTGAGSAGLTPINLTFATSSAPQTFTITPTATGTITLTQSAITSAVMPTFLASTTLTYTVNSTVPSTPTGVTATAGNTTATVSFYAPDSIGGSPITGYTVAGGGTDSNAGSTALTHTITGLTNGTPYTFTVTATNSVGAGSASSASNQITPDPPSITLTYPTTSITASSSITLIATTSDPVGIAGVTFYRGTTAIGSEITATSSPNTYSTSWNTALVTDGSYSITAVVRDTANNYATSSPAISVTVHNNPPNRTGGQPTGTLTVGTTATTLSLATDENASCKYLTSPGSSYSAMTAFSTTGTQSHSQSISGLQNNHSYNYYVKCMDTMGNVNLDDYVISFSVAADVSAPQITVTAPINGTTVHGHTVTLTATSTDDIGVTAVQFMIGNTPVGSSGATSPYSITWDSTTVSDGSHQIQAVANDAALNYATSTITVTVDNTGPTITVVASSSPTDSTAIITWTTGEFSDSQVAYGLTNTYGASSTLDSTLTEAHSVSLSNLTANATYHFRIASADNYGNTTYSSDYTLFTGDTTAPSVSLTSPSAGTVSDTVNLTATASDNIAVAGVQFILDSTTDIGSEITSTSSPNTYTTTWNSASVSDGSHTLSAIARDTSGNYATSTVTVTVSNAVSTPPTTSNGSSGGGGTLSAAQLAALLAPSASTTAYINSLATSTVPGCPSGFTCKLKIPTTILTISQPPFTRYLKQGSSGNDVKQLQIFLNTQGFTVANGVDLTGSPRAGSPGYETTYFGSATKTAIQKFQLAHKKEILDPLGLTAPTGFFGAATMKVMNEMMK